MLQPRDYDRYYCLFTDCNPIGVIHVPANTTDPTDKILECLRQHHDCDVTITSENIDLEAAQETEIRYDVNEDAAEYYGMVNVQQTWLY